MTRATLTSTRFRAFLMPVRMDFAVIDMCVTEHGIAPTNRALEPIRPYIVPELRRASRCAPSDAAQHRPCTAMQTKRILVVMVKRYQCNESDAPAASGRRSGAIAIPGFLVRVPVGELSAVCTSRVSMISETTAPSTPTPPTT